jgi:excisionase family DNA binding protein
MSRIVRADDWLSIAAAAARLGVSVRTVRRYTVDGKLPDTRSAGGRRIFRIVDLDALVTGRVSEGAVVLYGRVSSCRQQVEGDLDRQVATLREAAAGRVVAGQFTDVASGLSDRRKGLARALTACQDPAVDTLLVTHPDRLSRFGVGIIEHLLAGFGVAVVCIGESEQAAVESDLVRDMIAIVASCAGRLYGQRSAKARQVRTAVVTAVESDAGPS